MKLKREHKIGIFSVTTILLFFWGMNYLKGTDIFTQQISYFAVYEDVTGLIESNPVSLNGVNIGQVKRIDFMPDGTGRIMVECIISKSVPIPQNSVSVLTASSLTGSRDIIIRRGDSPQLIVHGDTLTGETESSMLDEVSEVVEPIKLRAENLFIQIDSLMAIVQDVFSEQNRTSIDRSFTSIKNTLSDIENTTGKLDETIDQETRKLSQIMENTRSITENLKNNNENLTNILENFSSISDSLAATNLTQTIRNTEESLTALNGILDKINRGEGTMGLLVNDEQLYHNLEASSKQLELLLEDIRNNPATYMRISVFGR